jgi:hypothetical protein
MGLIKDILLERNKANKARKNKWEIEQGKKALAGHHKGNKEGSKAVSKARLRAPHGTSWGGKDKMRSVSTNPKAAGENPDELKKIARAKRGNIDDSKEYFIDTTIAILLEHRFKDM